MVNGFLTLYFGMEVFPFFSDRPVGRIYYSTLTAGCKGLRLQRVMELLRASASALPLAAAAPRSPYRHLELCGIALKKSRQKLVEAYRFNELFKLSKKHIVGASIARPCPFAL